LFNDLADKTYSNISTFQNYDKQIVYSPSQCKGSYPKYGVSENTLNM